jgi:hypothetical protein
MRSMDSAAFLSTALATLFINAVVAVAIGCGIYVIRWLYYDVYARPRQAAESGVSATAASQ